LGVRIELQKVMSKLTQTLLEAEARRDKHFTMRPITSIFTILLTNKNMNYHKTLGSSVDAQKLSLTVKGILIGIVPVIIIVTKGFNIDLNNDELKSIIDMIVSSIVQAGALVSVITTLYGAIRKIANKFKK